MPLGLDALSRRPASFDMTFDASSHGETGPGSDLPSGAMDHDPYDGRLLGGRPLVSITMPFLNAEEFIDEAIASVMAQSTDDFELLLCDDGSTDGSTAIAQRWASQYPTHVRYLEHEGHVNKGMSATRNLGFSAARGEFA